jgi:hypothetical protein
MNGNTRVVVEAVRPGECVPAKGEKPFKYEAGDRGVLVWDWKGLNSPIIRVIWDKDSNVCREVRFRHLKPVGLERELDRVIVGFESRTRQ